MVTGCFNGKAMEKNSAHTLDRTLIEAEAAVKTRDWQQFLPIERIKTGITEIAFALLMYVALVAFCCFY
jgi:hypothetical protein